MKSSRLVTLGVRVDLEDLATAHRLRVSPRDLEDLAREPLRRRLGAGHQATPRLAVQHG